MSFHQVGRLDEAETLYRSIVSAAPYCVDALHFLGLVALQRGALDEGIGLLRRAVGLYPAAAIHCALARALLNRRDAAAALESCNAVIRADPAHFEAWFLRGNALQLGDAHERALESYERALRHAPAFAPALNNKAHSLRMLGMPVEALQALDRALEYQPRYPMALNNQGLALLDLNRPEHALKSFEAALAMQPSLAEAIGNRGTALMRLKRFAEAAAAFERLDAVAPGFDAALGNWVFARRNCCDWDGLDDLASRLQSMPQGTGLADMPLSYLYTSDSPGAQLECARAFVDSRYPPRPLPAMASSPDGHERILVAYLSGDFGEHAVSHLLAGVIEAHDATRFETIGVGWGRQNEGPTRRRLEAAFASFVDASQLSDGQVAALLRDLKVDIAVDLMGHTHGQRTAVFAHRAAPLQVLYLGFPGTSGARYMDYVIADAVVIPPAEDDWYCEQVVRLPQCYLPIDDRRSIADAPLTRAAAGLPAEGFVFCAFNNAAKFTPTVFGIWLRLLRAIPGSVLWLRTPGAQARANLERETRRAGLEPERLVFADAVASMDSHLARHRLADLFLDTLPYNAHTTACDALWAGLPVLTCRGRSFAGRVGASLLNTLHFPELITGTLAEYEARALELARDPERLASIRSRLAERRATNSLFDTRRYTRQLEAAYQAMRARQRSGLAPAGFAVEAIAPDEAVASDQAG